MGKGGGDTGIGAGLLSPKELFGDRPAGKLSAGQARRVNILRGIYKEPKLLVADEPDSELNRDLAKQYMDLILSRSETALIVTHNQDLLHLFDYLLVCEGGKVVKKCVKISEQNGKKETVQSS